MTRRYVGGSETTREQAERILANGTPEEICQALVDLAFTPDVDPAWVQDTYFDMLRGDNWMLWGISAVCLGHICGRIEVDLTTALPLLHAALRNPDAADQVCDGLRDIRHSHAALRAHEEIKHRAGLAHRIRQWQSKRATSPVLWSELEMFGADAEFPELSRLLDPFVEDESEPEPEERSVIEAEAHRVLAEIQAITTTTRPALFADQRESLRRRLRSIPDSDRDELLDLEVLLAIAALTIPAAAIAAEAMASRDLTTDEVGRILDALAESKG